MTIKFSKLCVCWAILVPTIYSFYVVFAGATPPDSVTYCIYGLSGVELIATAVIKRAEVKTDKGETILDKAADFINEDNIEAIAESKLGVDLKRNKESKKVTK